MRTDQQRQKPGDFTCRVGDVVRAVDFAQRNGDVSGWTVGYSKRRGPGGRAPLPRTRHFFSSGGRNRRQYSYFFPFLGVDGSVIIDDSTQREDRSNAQTASTQ